MMTGRQRMLAAFGRREADHVPVSPDLSAMVPVRLAGIPFDRAFLDGRPHYGYATATVAEAYVDAVKYFGMDGWYLYGSLPEICPEDRPHWDVTWAPRPQGGQTLRFSAQTPYGELAQAKIYPPDQPPWEEEKPIKELKRDWPRLRALMGEDENWRWAGDFTDRDRIGELGVFSVCIGIPQDWYFFQRQGGYNVMFFDFVDEETYMEEIMAFYTRYALARLRAVDAALQHEPYLCAGRFTAADVAVTYALHLAQHLELAAQFPPAVADYWQRMQARPAFQRALQAQHQGLGAHQDAVRRLARQRSHAHFFFTKTSSSVKLGRSPEKSTLRPNSMATCGA
jgi:hypothetical protein